MKCRGSRLQYDTYYYRGTGPSDSDYNKDCNPDTKHIPETCSSDQEIETEWKNALVCGWQNKYDGDYIAWKALEDVEKMTTDPDVLACIASTIYWKTGVDNCTNQLLTWWVLWLSGVYNDWAGQRDKAEKSVQNRVSTYDGRRDCSWIYQ